MTHVDYESVSRVVALSLEHERHWLDDRIDRQFDAEEARRAKAERAAATTWRWR